MAFRLPRFLSFSDLHIHAFRAFATFSNPFGDNSRRREIAARLNVVVEEANRRTEPYDALLFAGDFFHERLWVDVVSVWLAKSILKKLRIPFVACSGTHDMTHGGHSSLEVFKDMFVRRFWIDEDYAVPETNWVVVAVPHIRNPEEHMNEILTRAKRYPPSKNLLLLSHGDVVGASYGGGPIERGLNLKEISEAFNYSVIGHIHNPSQARNRDNKILIPGACIPHHFGDEGAGQIWRLEGVRDRYYLSAEPIAFEHPKFATMRVESDGKVILPGTDDYYRLVLAPGVSEIVVEPPGARYVVVRSSEPLPNEEGVVGEGTEVLTQETLIGKYVDYHYEGQHDAFKAHTGSEMLKRAGELLASDIEQDTLLEELERLLL